MSVLNVAKHVAYHKRCLGLLPSAFQETDLNRMSLGFFTVNSLDMLDRLSSIPELDREGYIDWIYHCQLSSGGFRGATATITPESSIYDAVNIPATYFAIALLLMLEDDLSRLNRKGALEVLRRSQNEDGSFSPVLIKGERFGEVDVRHCYCAIAVREMLSPIAPEEDINVSAIVHYLEQCKGYDGGYCQRPQLESHAGSTYCCIASLSMLGALQKSNDDTLRFLVFRQINSEDESENGGFNGRVNKDADTCYSFWAKGALDVLDALKYTSAELNREWLLAKGQHPQLGGFGKEEGQYPDPLHSALGLAVLSLDGQDGLVPFDAALCITKRAKDRLEKAPWRS